MSQRNLGASSSSSSSSSASASRAAAQPLDRDTQRHDLRLFHANMAASLGSLRALRRRFQCIVALMVASTVYWTWRLRSRLTSSELVPRTPQEELRLWGAWALLGVAPLVVFVCTGMYRKTVVEPSRFVDQLNRSLEPFYVIYSADTGQLHRILPPQPKHRPQAQPHAHPPHSQLQSQSQPQSHRRTSRLKS